MIITYIYFKSECGSNSQSDGIQKTESQDNNQPDNETSFTNTAGTSDIIQQNTSYDSLRQEKEGPCRRRNSDVERGNLKERTMENGAKSIHGFNNLNSGEKKHQQSTKLKVRTEKSAIILGLIVVLFLFTHSYRMIIKIYEVALPNSNTTENFKICFTLKRYFCIFKYFMVISNIN